MEHSLVGRLHNARTIRQLHEEQNDFKPAHLLFSTLTTNCVRQDIPLYPALPIDMQHALRATLSHQNNASAFSTAARLLSNDRRSLYYQG